MDIQLAILALLCISIHLFLCMASLRYYVHKYKLTKDEVISFSRELRFPFTIVLGDKPWITMTGDDDPLTYLMDKQLVVEGRIVWIVIVSIFPIAGIYGTITAKESSDGIERFIFVLLYSIILYFSARFGHSLKSKAQK